MIDAVDILNQRIADLEADKSRLLTDIGAYSAREFRMQERIAKIEAENQRLDDHSKEWGLKAQRVEHQLAEAQMKSELFDHLINQYDWAVKNPGMQNETSVLLCREDIAVDASMREGLE